MHRVDDDDLMDYQLDASINCNLIASGVKSWDALHLHHNGLSIIKVLLGKIKREFLQLEKNESICCRMFVTFFSFLL
jgi:hypothetical protein